MQYFRLQSPSLVTTYIINVQNLNTDNIFGHLFPLLWRKNLLSSTINTGIIFELLILCLVTTYKIYVENFNTDNKFLLFSL